MRVHGDGASRRPCRPGDPSAFPISPSPAAARGVSSCAFPSEFTANSTQAGRGWLCRWGGREGVRTQPLRPVPIPSVLVSCQPPGQRRAGVRTTTLKCALPDTAPHKRPRTSGGAPVGMGGEGNFRRPRPGLASGNRHFSWLMPAAHSPGSPCAHGKSTLRGSGSPLKPSALQPRLGPQLWAGPRFLQALGSGWCLGRRTALSLVPSACRDGAPG